MNWLRHWCFLSTLSRNSTCSGVSKTLLNVFSTKISVLCPEIRTSLFFAHVGRTFTDFVEIFVVGRESAEDMAIPYLFPSVWWDSGGDNIMLEEFDTSAPMFLTLLRNVFIGGFFAIFLHTVHSQLIQLGSSPTLLCHWLVTL